MKIQTAFLSLLLILTAFAPPAAACFGPKLYVGTPAGEEGELLYHLVAIYVHEKTGIESVRQEIPDGQPATGLLEKEQVDLTFAAAPKADWPILWQLSDQLGLLSGPRPTADLQFTTVPKALRKLNELWQAADLERLRAEVAAGTLPAKAVRKFYAERGWL